MQIETTSTTSVTKLLDVKSFDFIKRQLEECCIEAINSGGWILVSPDGKMYRGGIEQISAVVMTHHPIFKTGKPSFPIDA